MRAAEHNSVLLLSGGLDSTAIAAIVQPSLCLFIDYGQRPARAEQRAAEVVSEALGLPLVSRTFDLSSFGGGLLHDSQAMLPGAPSPEWWPFRNQFLVTAAAAVALQHGLGKVIVGSVKGDGDRHVDGSEVFYRTLDKLISMQEQNIRVSAPALTMSTEELVAHAGLDQRVLGWTVSCHRTNIACHECPGCWKREQVFDKLGIFQDWISHD
jgi:7-cyano-7-deazaguanine synthase